VAALYLGHVEPKIVAAAAVTRHGTSAVASFTNQWSRREPFAGGRGISQR